MDDMSPHLTNSSKFHSFIIFVTVNGVVLIDEFYHDTFQFKVLYFFARCFGTQQFISELWLKDNGILNKKRESLSHIMLIIG